MEPKGGENLRLQLSGSKTLDKLSLVYGVELSGREPIWAADRDFMKSRTRLGEKPDTIVGRKMLILVNTFLLVDVRPLMVYLTDQSIILDKQGRTIVPVVWHGQLIGLFRPKTAAKMVISV